ncbi:MAG: hypothetical protein R3C40_00125 [Parvularculaceae bacterium]
MCWKTPSSANNIPTTPRSNISISLSPSLSARYADFIGKEIQKAYLESYGEGGQNLFDRYISYADAWIEDQDFKDPGHRAIARPGDADAESSKIEKPAGIANPSKGDRQRGGEVSAAARLRRERRKEPGLDVVRKTALGHRKAHVQSG